MTEPSPNLRPIEEGEEIMVPESEQKFIDSLVEDEKASGRLSPENAKLFRKVLFDMAKDYLSLKRSPETVRELIQDNKEVIVDDLQNILESHNFTSEDAEGAARRMAKILEEDLELKADLDAAEAELHDRYKIPEHPLDDHLSAFHLVVIHHPRVGEILTTMLLDEESKLASLVPPEEREAYLARFRELYIEFLRAKRSGGEWKSSPEEQEFLTKYLLKFATAFLRAEKK